MKLLNTITLEIKKSKFIAYAYEIDTKEEAITILENLRKEHQRFFRTMPLTIFMRRMTRQLYRISRIPSPCTRYISAQTCAGR